MNKQLKAPEIVKSEHKKAASSHYTDPSGVW